MNSTGPVPARLSAFQVVARSNDPDTEEKTGLPGWFESAQ